MFESRHLSTKICITLIFAIVCAAVPHHGVYSDATSHLRRCSAVSDEERTATSARVIDQGTNEWTVWMMTTVVPKREEEIRCFEAESETSPIDPRDSVFFPSLCADRVIDHASGAITVKIFKPARDNWRAIIAVGSDLLFDDSDGLQTVLLSTAGLGVVKCTEERRPACDLASSVELIVPGVRDGVVRAGEEFEVQLVTSAFSAFRFSGNEEFQIRVTSPPESTSQMFPIVKHPMYKKRSSAVAESEWYFSANLSLHTSIPLHVGISAILLFPNSTALRPLDTVCRTSSEAEEHFCGEVVAQLVRAGKGLGITVDPKCGIDQLSDGYWHVLPSTCAISDSATRFHSREAVVTHLYPECTHGESVKGVPGCQPWERPMEDTFSPVLSGPCFVPDGLTLLATKDAPLAAAWRSRSGCLFDGWDYDRLLHDLDRNFINEIIFLGDSRERGLAKALALLLRMDESKFTKRLPLSTVVEYSIEQSQEIDKKILFLNLRKLHRDEDSWEMLWRSIFSGLEATAGCRQGQSGVIFFTLPLASVHHIDFMTYSHAAATNLFQQLQARCPNHQVIAVGQPSFHDEEQPQQALQGGVRRQRGLGNTALENQAPSISTQRELAISSFGCFLWMQNTRRQQLLMKEWKKSAELQQIPFIDLGPPTTARSDRCVDPVHYDDSTSAFMLQLLWNGAMPVMRARAEGFAS